MAVLTDSFGRWATSRVSVIARDRGYGHDANGNMTNDGELAYVWDGADRLKEVRSLQTGETLLSCRYDGMGRRRERVMNGETNRYIYHDWLVLEVRDAGNNVLESYTHGPDLSGSREGGGGIGGILSVTHAGTRNATYFYHYDANCNTVALTDTNGALVSTLD